MATNQYIGARYVPLFAEPIEWDKTKQYEPLTIVSHDGNSYTSRQFVPTGIEITNEAFWALTGNFNAQVEQYRNEVKAYDGRITTAQGTADEAKTAATAATTAATAATTAAGSAAAAVAEEKTRAEAKEVEIQSLAETNETDIAHLDAQMAATTGSELLNKITKEVTNRTEADTSLETSLTALINGKFPVQSSNLADGAVTTTKLADGAVTAPKIASSAVNSILQGLTIKRFDSKDSLADNDGLIVGPDCELAGFYVVELELLVITRYLGTNGNFGPDNKNMKLPSYIAKPNKKIHIAIIGAIAWNSSESFHDWTGLQIDPDLYIFPNSNISAGYNVAMPGNAVVYLRPFDSGTTVTSSYYDAFKNQNGVI